MYDETVKRLRNAAHWADKGLVITPSVCLEAADAIEELQKRVPKAPHGRLIDADVLQRSVPNFGFGYRSIIQGVIGVAPTIIPAEEGE